MVYIIATGVDHGKPQIAVIKAYVCMEQGLEVVLDNKLDVHPTKLYNARREVFTTTPSYSCESKARWWALALAIYIYILYMTATADKVMNYVWTSTRGSISAVIPSRLNAQCSLEAHNLMVYAMIQPYLAIEAGAGRDTLTVSTRECTV